jgi:hypothetical protein
MVPSVVFPPATELTAHVTAVFEEPSTEDENAKVAPARILAVVGATETETVAGVGFEGGVGLLGEEGVLVPAEQPNNRTAANTK